MKRNKKYTNLFETMKIIEKVEIDINRPMGLRLVIFQKRDHNYIWLFGGKTRLKKMDFVIFDTNYPYLF